MDRPCQKGIVWAWLPPQQPNELFLLFKGGHLQMLGGFWMTVYASWYKEKRTLTQESLRQAGKNPRACTHEHWSHASHIMHYVHCDCLAPQYWEYYPNIRLCHIGHPCHSSDFWRTPKPKPSSKWNQNLAAIWGHRDLLSVCLHCMHLMARALRPHSWTWKNGAYLLQKMTQKRRPARTHFPPLTHAEHLL